MEHPGMERLRAHFKSHNRQVFWLTVATIVIAAMLWAALYFLAWWLFLLVESTVKPPDFLPAAGPVARAFVATAVLLCLFAWLGRLLRPNEAPRDRKSFVENFLDVLLAVPRVTLSIFGTGAAAARLTDAELEHAWHLLRRMSDASKPVLMQELPVEIPDKEMRGKILLALQLGGVIEIRRAATGRILAFRNSDARRLAEERVRLRS